MTSEVEKKWYFSKKSQNVSHNINENPWFCVQTWKKSVHFRWYGSHGSLMIIFGIGGLYGIVSVQFFLFLKIFIFSWFFITEFTGMSSKIIKIHQKPMIFGDDRSNNSKKNHEKMKIFKNTKNCTLTILWSPSVPKRIGEHPWEPCERTCTLFFHGFWELPETICISLCLIWSIG